MLHSSYRGVYEGLGVVVRSRCMDVSFKKVAFHCSSMAVQVQYTDRDTEDLNIDELDEVLIPISNSESELRKKRRLPAGPTALLEDEDNECAICLEVMNGGTAVLRCGHEFHAACLVNWNGSSARCNCPMCRRHFSARGVCQENGRLL